MYEIIKKFLNDGGKCLLIEDSKPVGVFLSIKEYELLQSKSSSSAKASEDKQTNPEGEVVAPNPIGEAMAKEMDFPGASAEIADIEAVDDVTLEDLGIDELPY